MDPITIAFLLIAAPFFMLGALLSHLVTNLAHHLFQ